MGFHYLSQLKVTMLNDMINVHEQIADELLADADVARDIARDAIAKAEKTLEDARDTLDTLRGQLNVKDILYLNIFSCLF